MAEITRYNWIKNDKFNSKANISAELNEAVSHFDFSDVDYSTIEETPEFEPYSIPDVVAEFPV